jgi:alpha-1,6-mannosyltransferase
MSPDVAARLFTPPAAAARSFGRQLLPQPQHRAERTILDVSEFFGSSSGGVRTYLIEKAKYVERSRDIRQSILVPGPWDAITESQRVRCYWLGGPRVPGQAPYRFLLDAPSSRRILESERPDIVEVGSPGFAPWHVAKAARRHGIPIVSFFHSHVPRLVAGIKRPPTTIRRAGASLAWRYLRRIDRMFARTIVSSRFAAEELATAGIDRTSYVPLGVDLDVFHPRRQVLREQTRARLAVDERPLVVYAGRVAMEKQLDTLLRVWPEVARRTGAVLVIAGDGPLRRSLAARYPHPDVRWLGFLAHRHRVADLLAAADIVVSSGAIETFGLAALEALASGTPVLSAHLGGAAELVRDSSGGLLFETGDERSLARAIEALLGADRAAMGARGRAHAERNHDWSAVFDAVFDVYDDVLARAT